MKLPNLELAMVLRAKVVDYLLSDVHHDGRHKAAFFKRFGFAVEEWERFVETDEETPRFVTAYPLRRDADD